MAQTSTKCYALALSSGLNACYPLWVNFALVLDRRPARFAVAPAEGLRGLVLKLGLHQFLNDHADAASLQVDSAYTDLVRLTGHDPLTEICDRFEREAA